MWPTTIKLNGTRIGLGITVRTHGWGGAAPSSDDEAVARILRAAGEILDEGADEVTILQVAKRLAVTRPTVYRYYSSTDELLEATAAHAADDFLRGLACSVEGITDLTEAVIQALATTVERLHANRRFRVLFSDDFRGKVIPKVTSASAVELGRSIVDEFEVDWSGWGERDKNELVEHMLRTLQSFILDPGDPPRLGDALRDYLRRWVVPVSFTAPPPLAGSRRHR